ncbi:cytochrome b/b6 domain-containing protein [Pararhodobacter zhoushanensis]|uniref:Cytochrome b/b6 domain-containing protein n=1 Tax=Pararhodobacter zhoushanensis TaxID=2479545 RepID=A0ABT3H091_9RHOB|nr:cytochrome b/b6 domain-containing protein [Pararhodobacter zhoushanensis]MCW1933198.1 cytochrome b/b6 domain-containing protein [Pararhodobacter zhoushanensis]
MTEAVTHRGWDPVVRALHGALALSFLANAALIDRHSLLHRWIGYGIVALVLARLAWGMIGPRHARFADFPPDLTAVAAQIRDLALGRRRQPVGHAPLRALMVCNLLAVMLLLGLTGWIVTLPEATLGHDPEWAEELHELLSGWAVISVLVHIVVVVFLSLRTRVTLIRAMKPRRKTFLDE